MAPKAKKTASKEEKPVEAAPAAPVEAKSPAKKAAKSPKKSPAAKKPTPKKPTGERHSDRLFGRDDVQAAQMHAHTT